MKRFLAATLWLFSFWYLGSAVAMLLNLPDLLGPTLGLSAGLIVGLDPRGAIWTRRNRQGWSPA